MDSQKILEILGMLLSEQTGCDVRFVTDAEEKQSLTVLSNGDVR